MIGGAIGGGKGAGIGALIGAGAGVAGVMLTKGNEAELRAVPRSVWLRFAQSLSP